MRGGILAAAVAAALGGCAGGSPCGPGEAEVARVIDGDTIELVGGVRVRYLMVDTPEITGGKHECFGPNAAELNATLVLGERVTLAYDVECEDRFGRTLAYVSVNGREVNSLLIERGYGCVLHVPPNGDDRVAELLALQDAARAARRGLWGACDPLPCQ